MSEPFPFENITKNTPDIIIENLEKNEKELELKVAKFFKLSPRYLDLSF